MSAYIFDCCTSFTHQFNLNYEETKNVAIGHSVSSADISDGGHLWRIQCLPRGDRKEDKDEYVSIFLHLESDSEDVKAILEAFVMDRDGAPSLSHRHRFVHVYKPKGSNSSSQGWPKFVERSVLESLYVTDGSVIIMCGVKVVGNDSIDVPLSNIGCHLGLLLDSTDGSDVSFVVDGEEFPAHRAVLAARSPVFKAQLLGSMADAKMASIDHLAGHHRCDVQSHASVIYTDDLPEDDESEDTPTETFQDLLAAADRYALDRLKLMCAGKLWDDVSADTVGAILACAETYNCQELKTKCIGFFAEEKNFKNAVLTDGFAQLVHKFPSILAELREKVGA